MDKVISRAPCDIPASWEALLRIKCNRVRPIIVLIGQVDIRARISRLVYRPLLGLAAGRYMDGAC